MNHTPFFSVIIPLYNKSQYIQRCLYSVVRQDFSDFEIVLVDDCSTDNGLKLARYFMEQNNCRFQIVERGHRGGSCAPARATGCRYAVGSLFAFLDADDEWLPGFLSEVKRLHDSFRNAEAYATDRELVYEYSAQPGPYGYRQEHKAEHLIDLEGFLLARKHSGNPFRVPGMAFKPQSLDDVGGFVHAPRSSDVDLYFRFLLSGKYIAWSPYIGLRIHRVRGSTMSSTTLQPTRPWFYTVTYALHRGGLSNELRILLESDLTRRKRTDIYDAVKQGRLDRSFMNHIFFWRAPITYSFAYILLIFPASLQIALSPVLRFLKTLEQRLV